MRWNLAFLIFHPSPYSDFSALSITSHCQGWKKTSFSAKSHPSPWKQCVFEPKTVHIKCAPGVRYQMGSRWRKGLTWMDFQSGTVPFTYLWRWTCTMSPQRTLFFAESYMRSFSFLFFLMQRATPHHLQRWPVVEHFNQLFLRFKDFSFDLQLVGVELQGAIRKNATPRTKGRWNTALII